MSDKAHAAVRRQRAMLRAGAVLDAMFALAMLLVPEPASGFLRLPLPVDMTWFRLCGVLLLIAAGCYAVAAHGTPTTVTGIAVVAAAGRALGCVVLVHEGLAQHAPALLVTGIVDGAFALAHACLAAASRSRG